jgi:hypothetical protein
VKKKGEMGEYLRKTGMMYDVFLCLFMVDDDDAGLI